MKMNEANGGTNQFHVPLLTIEGLCNNEPRSPGKTGTAKAPRATLQSMETTPRTPHAKDQFIQRIKLFDSGSPVKSGMNSSIHGGRVNLSSSKTDSLHPLHLGLDNMDTDSSSRSHSIRLPSVCADPLTFRDTSAAFQALDQNKGIEQELDYALRPLTYCRNVFGSSKFVQYTSAAVLASLSCYGLAMCFLCYYWKTQEKRESSEKAFGSGFTSIANIFVHFLQGIVGVFYMRKTDINMSRFIELWLEAYASCVNQHPPVKKLRRLSTFFACYVVIGSLALTILWSVGFMQVTPWITFSDNCSCFFPPVKDAPRFLNGFLLGIVTLPNLYCQAMYAMLCMILFYEFWHFGCQFDFVYQSSYPDTFLASYRQQHHQLIRLTDFVDNHLSYYAWWIYCLNIPAICLVLYAVFLDESITAGGIVGLSIWCFQLTGQIAIISIPPAAITHQAHLPLNQIQEFASKPRDSTSKLGQDWLLVRSNDPQSTVRSVVPISQDRGLSDIPTDQLISSTTHKPSYWNHMWRLLHAD